MFFDIKSVKFIREKPFLSQTDLANLLDVSFSSISRWESGTFEPTIKAKKKISELTRMGISFDEVIERIKKWKY